MEEIHIDLELRVKLFYIILLMLARIYIFPRIRGKSKSVLSLCTYDEKGYYRHMIIVQGTCLVSFYMSKPNWLCMAKPPLI